MSLLSSSDAIPTSLATLSSAISSLDSTLTPTSAFASQTSTTSSISSSLPTTTPSPTSEVIPGTEGGSTYVNSKLIIALSVSAFAFLIFLILIISTLCRRSRRKSKAKESLMGSDGEMGFKSQSHSHNQSVSSGLAFLPKHKNFNSQDYDNVKDDGRMEMTPPLDYYDSSAFESPNSNHSPSKVKNLSPIQTQERYPTYPISAEPESLLNQRETGFDPSTLTLESDSPTSTAEMSFREWERRREEANGRGQDQEETTFYNPHDDDQLFENARLRNPYDEIEVDGNGPEGGRVSESQRIREQYVLK